MTRYSLSDKVVLISGAGRGLGATTATVLAQRGARVVLADIDVSAAQRVAATLPNGRGLALECDVTQFHSVQEAVRRTREEFGRIDVVIANAGILGRGGTFRTLTPDQVSGVMSVNVGGVVNTVAATLESVISSRGQIVLVSSVFAYLNGAGAIPYAMSKAAVEQLGRGLRVELASHGASAMTAYFSLIETDMIRQGVDADPHVSGLLSAMPKFILKRIKPQTAAAAIADGLERPGARRSATRTRSILCHTADHHLKAAFDHSFDAVLAATPARSRLDEQILDVAVSARFADPVNRLGCLRGISALTGLALTVQIGDWSRFTGSSIGAYVGLVPSEFSSGTSRVQGSITKAGNTHVRRLLIEAARHHRKSYSTSGPTLRARWAKVDPALRARGHAGNRRLNKRWRSFTE